MRKIKKLSIELSNQIAAGEVIERPSAVVKELVENSIDAEADYIEITVRDSGVGLIRVRDNGSGIAKEDLFLAIARHATSKIYSQEELLNVNSLGFRGEALASISSVAQFKIVSRTNDAAEAWCLNNNQVIPAQHPVGTTVEVSDLFFNIKARRYFLRSKRTELLHIEETVRRLALSNFNVAFKFIIDDKTVLNLPLANNKILQEERIKKVLGKNFVEHCVSMQCQNDSMSLNGWLGARSYHTAQNNEQFIFLNKRAVKDKVLLHAIRSCYREFIPEGRHCAFILFLELDPREVDVNVHPTKTEVRLRKMRLVYDFMHKNIGINLDKEKSPRRALRGDPLLKGGNQENASFAKGGNQENASFLKGYNEESAPFLKGGSGVAAGDFSTAGKISNLPTKEFSFVKLFFQRYALIERHNEYWIVDLKKAHSMLNSTTPWELLSSTITIKEISNLVQHADQSCYRKITEKFFELE